MTAKFLAALAASVLTVTTAQAATTQTRSSSAVVAKKFALVTPTARKDVGLCTAAPAQMKSRLALIKAGKLSAKCAVVSSTGAKAAKYVAAVDPVVGTGTSVASTGGMSVAEIAAIGIPAAAAVTVGAVSAANSGS